MRRITITSMLNLRLRLIVKSDGRYQNSLLHIGRCVLNRTDDENTTLCTMFSNFFVDEICALKRAVAAEVASLSTSLQPMHSLLANLSMPYPQLL